MEEVPEISAAGLEIVALMNGVAADPMSTCLMGRMGLGSVGRRREKWVVEKHSDSID